MDKRKKKNRKIRAQLRMGGNRIKFYPKWCDGASKLFLFLWKFVEIIELKFILAWNFLDPQVINSYRSEVNIIERFFNKKIKSL